MPEDTRATISVANLPRWVWAAIIGIATMFVIISIVFVVRGSDADASVGQVEQPARTVTVIAPVGRWSENFSVPPEHWCRITSNGKIKVKTWDGREIDDEPGRNTWLGHEVLDANFKFMSREDTSVAVTIVLRQK